MYPWVLHCVPCFGGQPRAKELANLNTMKENSKAFSFYFLSKHLSKEFKGFTHVKDNMGEWKIKYFFFFFNEGNSKNQVEFNLFILLLTYYSVLFF